MSIINDVNWRGNGTATAQLVDWVVTTEEGEELALSLYPWEDPLLVAQEAEAMLAEQDAKPVIGLDISDDHSLDFEMLLEEYRAIGQRCVLVAVADPTMQDIADERFEAGLKFAPYAW